MKVNCTISIIVPVYNSEKSLHRCITSLVNQTYKSIEIILVNDGSRDSSPEICDFYSQNYSNIKVLHKENGGVSSARNVGIENASGMYIMFVDSDDYVSEYYCEEMYSALEESNAMMACCAYFSEENNDITENLMKFSSECTLTDSAEWCLSSYINYPMFLCVPWNKIFKKELIKSYFDCNIKYGEDLRFNVSYMSQIDKIVVVNKPLYYYVKGNAGSLNHDISARLKSDADNVRTVECYLEEKKICPAYFGDLYYKHFITDCKMKGVSYSNVSYVIRELVQNGGYDRVIKERKPRSFKLLPFYFALKYRIVLAAYVPLHIQKIFHRG